MPFLGPALTSMMVYMYVAIVDSLGLIILLNYSWARRNPDVRMTFLGLMNFNAPYLPWVMMGFSLLISGHLPIADAVGAAIGHMYYFLDDVYPIISGTGRRYLRAPPLM